MDIGQKHIRRRMQTVEAQYLYSSLYEVAVAVDFGQFITLFMIVLDNMENIERASSFRYKN